MFALVALAVSVGIVDSLNPSTVGPALYLATAPDGARRLAAFTGGVLAVGLAGGLVLTLGPGQAILAAVPRPGRTTTHGIELGLGVAALLLALVLWLRRSAVARHLSGGGERARGAGSSFLVGAAIMAVELPTAFPYFAVIAAIVSSGRRLSEQVSPVPPFNPPLVGPLIAILAVRALAGDAPGSRLHAA